MARQPREKAGVAAPSAIYDEMRRQSAAFAKP